MSAAELFTQDFLAVGITETQAWRDVADAQLDAFVVALRRIYRPYRADSRPNEATTEQEIIGSGRKEALRHLRQSDA